MGGDESTPCGRVFWGANPNKKGVKERGRGGSWVPPSYLGLRCLLGVPCEDLGQCQSRTQKRRTERTGGSVTSARGGSFLQQTFSPDPKKGTRREIFFPGKKIPHSLCRGEKKTARSIKNLEPKWETEGGRGSRDRAGEEARGGGGRGKTVFRTKGHEKKRLRNQKKSRKKSPRKEGHAASLGLTSTERRKRKQMDRPIRHNVTSGNGVLWGLGCSPFISKDTKGGTARPLYCRSIRKAIQSRGMKRKRCAAKQRKINHTRGEQQLFILCSNRAKIKGDAPLVSSRA